MATPVKKLFISYRRSQAENVAHSLHRILAGSGLFETVFLDEETIKHGGNWQDEIFKNLEACDCFLLLIHQGWAPRSGGDDWLHKEVAHALERLRKISDEEGAPPFLFSPVLLDGAEMPSKDDLPDDLSDLPEIHTSVELRTNGKWLKKDVYNELLPQLGYASGAALRNTASMPAVSIPPMMQSSGFCEREAKVVLAEADHDLRTQEYTHAYSEFSSLLKRSQEVFGSDNLFTVTARQRLGETQARDGKHEAGRRLLEAASAEIDAQPNLPPQLAVRCKLWLACCYRSEGRLDDAKRLLDELNAQSDEIEEYRKSPDLFYRLHLEQARLLRDQGSPRQAFRILRKDMGSASAKCQATDPILAQELASEHGQLSDLRRRQVLLHSGLAISALLLLGFVILQKVMPELVEQVSSSMFASTDNTADGPDAAQLPVAIVDAGAPDAAPRTVGDVDIVSKVGALRAETDHPPGSVTGQFSFTGGPPDTSLILPLSEWTSKCRSWRDCAGQSHLAFIGDASRTELTLQKTDRYAFEFWRPGHVPDRFDVESDIWQKFPSQKAEHPIPVLKQAKSTIYALQVRDTNELKSARVLLRKTIRVPMGEERVAGTLVLSLGVSLSTGALPALIDEVGQGSPAGHDQTAAKQREALDLLASNLKMLEDLLDLEWFEQYRLTPVTLEAFASHPKTPRKSKRMRSSKVDGLGSIHEKHEEQFMKWAVPYLAQEITDRHPRCKLRSSPALGKKNLKALRLKRRDIRRLRRENKEAVWVVKRVAREIKKHSQDVGKTQVILIPESWDPRYREVIVALNACMAPPAPVVEAELIAKEDAPPGATGAAALDLKGSINGLVEGGPKSAEPLALPNKTGSASGALAVSTGSTRAPSAATTVARTQGSRAAQEKPRDDARTRPQPTGAEIPSRETPNGASSGEGTSRTNTVQGGSLAQDPSVGEPAIELVKSAMKKTTWLCTCSLYADEDGALRGRWQDNIDSVTRVGAEKFGANQSCESATAEHGVDCKRCSCGPAGATPFGVRLDKISPPTSSKAKGEAGAKAGSQFDAGVQTESP